MNLEYIIAAQTQGVLSSSNRQGRGYKVCMHSRKGIQGPQQNVQDTLWAGMAEGMTRY